MKINFKIIIFFFIIIAVLNSALFAGDETIINHKTSHSFKVNSFILPKEKEFKSNIEELKKNAAVEILNLIRNSEKITVPYLNILPPVSEPLFNLPKYINIFKELKSVNFNNIKLSIVVKDPPKLQNKLFLKLFKNLNNRFAEIYSENVEPSFIHTDLFYTLKSGVYKFQLFSNEISIGGSDTFEISNYDNRSLVIETAQSKPVKIRLLCSDGKTPLNEAVVALKYKTGGIIETGKTNSSGMIIWDLSKKQEIKIPASVDDDFYFILEIINQRQKIGDEKLIFTEENLKKLTFNIKTNQRPKSFYMDKKIKLKGKITGDFIAKNLPVPYIKISFYEKEVGFLDLYGNDASFLKIGECKTFSDGSFEFENMDVDDGPNQSTRDIIVSAELESDYVVMYNAMLGTKTIYKYKIDLQENIWPYNSEFDFGEINLSSLNFEKPLALYQILQNQLINFKNENPVYNRTILAAYPATKIYMNISEDIKYFYGDNILKITKKGGDYILKYGITSDNVVDLLREAANSNLYR